MRGAGHRRGESLIARVKNILTRPAETWDVIDGETIGVGELYRGYVALLGAIPAVCAAVSGPLGFGGVHIFGVRYMPGPGVIIGQMLLTYVLTLVEVYVLALIVERLAPRFDAQPSRTQAFKLAAYAGTASWVAGVFMLLPTVGGLIAFLGGLYSLYLLYLGLPPADGGQRRAPDGLFRRILLVVAFLFAVLIGALTELRQRGSAGRGLDLARRGRRGRPARLRRTSTSWATVPPAAARSSSRAFGPSSSTGSPDAADVSPRSITSRSMLTINSGRRAPATQA